MWGANFHLLKEMLATVNFIEAAFWRYLFAVFALTLFVIQKLPSWRSFLANIKGILLIGIFGLFGFNILLFWGLEYTSSVNASLIISLSPMTTLLLSYVFFKTKINTTQLSGMVLGILGVLYLLTKGHPGNFTIRSLSLGDVLVLIAMVLASSYHLGVKKYMENMSNLHFTFFTNLICLLCFLVILPTSTIPEPWEYGMSFWSVAAVFGIIGTSITYLLWNEGVGMIGPARAGVYMNLVPLSTALVAVLLGQSLNVYHYISGTLIFCGLLVFRIKRNDEDEIIITLLSSRLRKQNVQLLTSQNFYSNIIDFTTMSEIDSSNVFFGIITANGSNKTRVFEEWKYSYKKGISNILLIEDTVQLKGKLSDNHIIFNRNNPEDAINQINSRINSNKSDNSWAWLLGGGAAFLGIIALLSKEK